MELQNKLFVNKFQPNYFDDFNEENMFDFIIVNAPKFIKSLKFFDIDTQVKMDIIYKPHHENEGVMQIRSAQFTNGKLKNEYNYNHHIF